MDIPGDSPTSTVRSLTPAEVHNVAFKKPPIGKRGYDEEEVDNFLDVVEAELARLIEENESLRNHAPALDGSNLANVTDQGLVEENRRLNEALQLAVQEQTNALARQQEEHALALASASQGKDGASEAQLRLQEALQSAEQRVQSAEQRVQAAEQRVQAAEQAAAQAQEQARRAAAAQPSAGVGSHEQAVKVLALAQQTADQHLAASKTEADAMVNEAKSTAAQLTAESTAAADRRVSEAQARADALQRESQAQAAKAVQDAEQHASAVNEALETRKAALERRLEELSTFEREYRSRLKSYLESQLRDLEHGGADDGEAPVPPPT